MITLFGIKNCDTIKKTKKWLESHDLHYQFHDYRADGLDPAWLADILDKHSWEIVLNKRGTTYRQLSEEQKTDINNDKALALLSEFPAMIKRPILQRDDTVVIGFNANQLEETFT